MVTTAKTSKGDLSVTICQPKFEPPRGPQGPAPTYCTKRKVRCDKRLPFQQCVNRGQAHECKWELVRARGHLVKNAPSEWAQPGDRNYANNSILQENSIPRSRLAGQDAQTIVETSETNAEAAPRLHTRGNSRTAVVVQCLFDEIGTSSRPRTVCELNDIIIPFQYFGQDMVENALERTFWIHFALFTPQFRREHEDFWDSLRANQSESLAEMDPAWMAIYFSLLDSTLMFMDEDDTNDRRPASVDFTTRSTTRGLLLSAERRNSSHAMSRSSRGSA